MSSRLVLGKSTKAKARLEALLRVIDWLTGGFTTADWAKVPSWPWAVRQSPRALGCVADGRGDASGGGGYGEAPPVDRVRPGRRVNEKPFCDGGRGASLF